MSESRKSETKYRKIEINFKYISDAIFALLFIILFRFLYIRNMDFYDEI